MCRAWSHPARQPPSSRVAEEIQCATNICLTEVFISHALLRLGGLKGWGCACSFRQTSRCSERLIECISSKTKWGAPKPLWPIYSPHDAADYSSSTFHAGQHACLTACHRIVLRPPPPQSESPSEPSYPASMCQSHLNDPDNKTKAINLWYWPGGRVGDNTDAISERQQRRRFSAWGWLETR